MLQQVRILKKSFATIRAIASVSAVTAMMLSLVFAQAIHLQQHGHHHGTVAESETPAKPSGCHHDKDGHHHHGHPSDQHPAEEDGDHRHPTHEHDCSICGVIGQASVPTMVMQFVVSETAETAAPQIDQRELSDARPGLIPARGPPAIVG